MNVAVGVVVLSLGVLADSPRHAETKRIESRETAARKEWGCLAGTWDLESLETEGTWQLLETEKHQIRFGVYEFMSSQTAGEDSGTARLMIDPTGKTYQMIREGQVVDEGLYEINGDTFRVCFYLSHQG